jgi:cytochrome P450
MLRWDAILIQMAMLRRDRSMMPRAIEEMVRYDGPVQATGRTLLKMSKSEERLSKREPKRL